MAQYNVRQRENLLKDALIRQEDPEIEAAEIVTLDRIQVPDTDDLAAAAPIGGDGHGEAARCGGFEIPRPNPADRAGGDRESSVAEFAPCNCKPITAAWPVRPNSTPDPYFVGGYGTALKQILRREFSQ